MSSSSSLGLALLGSNALSPHLAAIRHNALFHVVGHWAEQAVDEGLCRVEDPTALIRDPRVQAVVICQSANEREYWAREVVRAGKTVLCDGLPAVTYTRLCQLAAAAREGGTEVGVVPRLGTGVEVLAAAQAGRVFVSLTGRLPQASLNGTRDGLLVHWGAFCLQLLAQRHGRLDSVYARTRSLGLNRPEEDLVSAQLRFANGVEGLVSLVALGPESGIVLEEWGEGESQQQRIDWHQHGAGGLTPVYAALVDTLQTGTPVPVSLRLPLEGMRWAEWFQQSARMDREVFADEVANG